jgi:predicted GH43/DUF377 family glycosyl hydrolase
MVNIKKEGVLLEATGHEFENQAVLNPACVKDGNNIHMFYRAVKNGNYSSVGYCRLDGPLNVVERLDTPVLTYEHDYEKHGLEDPRVVLFEGTYYMTYTAYDGKNAMIAYATSKDMKNWEKHGIISPQITYDEAEDLFRENNQQLKEKYYFFESYYKDKVARDVLLWEKDAFFLPEKINGKYAMIHRILPEIQIAYFDDFKQLKDDNYWRDYLKNLDDYILFEPKHGFESRNIGAGGPFLETDKGWLMIYHAVEDTNQGKTYHASAALLSRDNTLKVLGRLSKPLFSPTENYELKGDVNNVVFPTAQALFGDKLYIYYGAADKRIAVASCSLKELLNELLVVDAIL